jgi:hypothetical protein
MAQKAKREDEKSPPEKMPGVSLLEQSHSMAPSSAADVSTPSSQEKSPVEKKGNGGEGISPGELLDLEQQKLAGKKKGNPLKGL